MLDMAKVPGYQTSGGYAPQPMSRKAAPEVGAQQSGQQAPPSGAAGGPGYSMGFQTPQQFNQAGQIYSQLGQGKYQIPRQIQQGSEYANQMYQQQGMPGSTQDYQRAAMPVIQKQMEDIRKQAMASANVSGMGNSSVLGRQIGQQQGDLMNQFNLGLADRQFGLDEAGRGRMMQAMGMLGQFGGQEQQADQFGQNMALQAGQSLQGLGQDYFSMPFNVAQGMSGLGAQYNQAMATPLDQLQMQGLGLGAQASGQQQYTPGFLTNLATGLQGAAQYAPALASYFGAQGAAPGAGAGFNPATSYSGFNPAQFNLARPGSGFSVSPNRPPMQFPE